MSDEMQFEIAIAAKPVAGVTIVEVPAKLAEGLAKLVPQVMKDKDHELTLTAANKADAQKLALYARAWGARQEPKYYIHKVPNGKRYPENVARLAVSLDKDVPAENRPGRRGGQ